jgi:cobalt-zinc-cadmium efflux system protein
VNIFPQTNYIKCTNGAEQYRMSYTAWGKQVASGKTLICVHGVNRNSRDWDFVGQHFAKIGYYVIAPDIVGRGSSDYLINWEGYAIPAYVNDILFMIKTLGLENIDFIGTSMGGLIGMSIAALPGHPLKKLVLNDIGAEIESAGLKRISEYTDNQPEFATFEDAQAYLLKISEDFAVPPELEDFYTMTSFQKNNNGKYELKRDPNISKLFSTVFDGSKNVELWQYWQQVKIDVLVVHGAKSDLLNTAIIDKMKSINPRTQSVVINNAGHAPYLYSGSHMSFLEGFLL